MRWIGISCVLGAVAGLTVACGGAEFEDGTALEQTSVEVGAVEVKPAGVGAGADSASRIAYGKYLADEMLAIYRANQTSPMSEILELMGPQLTALQELNLSSAEAKPIDEHFQYRGHDIIDGIAEYEPEDPVFEPGGNGGVNELPEGYCLTYCLGFFLFRCGTTDVVGTCADFWTCDDHRPKDCSGGECKNDDDCPDGEYCKDGFWEAGRGECVQQKKNGSSCSDDDQCKSGCCNYNFFGSECAKKSKCN